MDDLLGIMQMSDSAFPAGTFAMSNGLESMYLAGNITTPDGLEELLHWQLVHQIGPSDCTAAALAHRHAKNGNMDELLKLDIQYIASKSVQEYREASVRSGTQMIRCVTEILDGDIISAYARQIQGEVSGAYPVSFGVCCQAMGISRYGTALAISYGFVSVCVGAALRLGMIQHIEGQHAIHASKPYMKEAAHIGCTADAMWQFCPQTEILQMAHERQDSKMFIT